jgi:hypothetical protein
MEYYFHYQKKKIVRFELSLYFAISRTLFVYKGVFPSTTYIPKFNLASVYIRR